MTLPRLAGLLAAFALCLAPGSADARPPLRRLTIVHTNDLHAHLETFAVVAAVGKREMARNPEGALWLDAGDVITGTPVSTLYQGLPVYEILNRLPITAGCLGNHEFDHGWKRVHQFVETARQPLLCANVLDPDGKPFGDGASRVFEVGGVRVGVLGLMTGDLRRVTSAAATEGCAVTPPLDAAKRLVPELRKKADLVVLLTHIGVDQDGALAGAVAGIDLVVGGHTHTRLDKALTSPLGTKIVQAGRFGEYVGVIDLALDADGKIAEFSSKLISTDTAGLPRDEDVAKLVAQWEAKADLVVAPVIGRADKDLGKKELVDVLGRIFKDVLGSDLGYQNLHGVRDVVRKGDVRIRDVWNLVPFDNTLVEVEIPGERLHAWAKKELGSRFEPGKTYTVATNSYVGDHAREIFGDDFPVTDRGLSMRDAVVKWVRDHGGFDPAGKPLETR